MWDNILGKSSYYQHGNEFIAIHEAEADFGDLTSSDRRTSLMAYQGYSPFMRLAAT